MRQNQFYFDIVPFMVRTLLLSMLLRLIPIGGKVTNINYDVFIWTFQFMTSLPPSLSFISSFFFLEMYFA